jgi:hypothetical protein
MPIQPQVSPAFCALLARSPAAALAPRQQFRPGIAVLVAVLVASTAGCGADAMDPSDGLAAAPLGSTAQALGEASCATTSPTAVLTGGAEFQSPTGYSQAGCFKAQVVDIPDLAIGGSVNVRFRGTGGSTRSICETQWLGATFYAQIDGVFEQLDFVSARGSWTDAEGCTRPESNFNLDPLSYGLSSDEVEGLSGARVAASARMSSSSAAQTRALSVNYANP